MNLKDQGAPIGAPWCVEVSSPGTVQRRRNTEILPFGFAQGQDEGLLEPGLVIDCEHDGELRYA